MEEDIVYGKSSTESNFRASITDRLKEAIDTAEERQKYDSAHNPDILMALNVVKDFIKRKGRVCYGGTAMNAILPESKQFYSPEIDLPDYDFFTAEADADIDDLMRDLDKAGFKEIYHKIGIHEGTTKVMVNFIPVADITQISKEMYDVYHRRALIRDGVRHSDPDMLRMMMYLEISRPKGVVSRWDKVFERLQLINASFPIDASDCKPVKKIDLDPATARTIYDIAIERQRVLCSESLIPLYARGIRGGESVLDIKISGGPILFTSPAAKEDAMEIQRLITGCKLYRHRPHEGAVPTRIEVRRNGQPIALIIEEVACHSYYQLPTSDGRIALIGSIEFLITLYLSLHIFTQSSSFFTKGIRCIVRNLIALSIKNYSAKTSQFAPFAILCKGHQTGFASLLRKKMERLKKHKLTYKNTTQLRKGVKTRKRATQ